MNNRGIPFGDILYMSRSDTFIFQYSFFSLHYSFWNYDPRGLRAAQTVRIAVGPVFVVAAIGALI